MGALRGEGVGRLGGSALWLLPLIFVLQLNGKTFGAPLLATALLVALFALILWLPKADAGGLAQGVLEWRWSHWLGGALLLLGLGSMLVGIGPWLWPSFWQDRLPARWSTAEARLLLPLISCWPLALSVPLLRRRGSLHDLERLGLLVGLSFVGLLAGGFRYQGLAVLPYGNPTLRMVLGGAAIALALLLLVPRLPAWLKLVVLVSAALSIRWLGLSTYPLDPAVRDMLPLVASAQDAFFAGKNPYVVHTMQPGSEVPLTYLPGLWLLWSVPRLLSADIRVMGLIVDAAIVGLLWWAARGASSGYRTRGQCAVVCFAAVWLFCPSVHWNGLYAEPHVWWLVLAALSASMLRQRYWLAAVCLGAALATRQFGLVVAVFAAIAMLRALGVKQAVARLGLAGAVAALLLVPFVITDADMFWFGTFRWLVEYGPAHQGWFFEKFGFSGTLYKAGHAAWMPWAQGIAVLAMLPLALLLRGARGFVAPAGSAYLLLIAFNGIIWDSFYLGAALFAGFAAATGTTTAAAMAEAPVKPLRNKVQLVFATLFGLSTAAGAWLVYSLITARSQAGYEALNYYLSVKKKAGDAILDRSDFHLGFVRGRTVEGSLVGIDPFDSRLGMQGLFGHARAHAVLRHQSDRLLAQKLTEAARGHDAKEFGRFRLLSLHGIQSSSRLSESPFEAHLTALDDAAPPAFRQLGPQRYQSPTLEFLEVGPRRCQIARRMRAMIYVHPANGTAVQLVWREAKLGRALLVFGGLIDGHAAYRRAPVEVGVRVDEQAAGSLDIKNRSGMSWQVFQTSPGTRRVAFTVSTADETQRKTCLDAYVLAAD